MCRVFLAPFKPEQVTNKYSRECGWEQQPTRASSNNYWEMFNRKFQASSNTVLHVNDDSLFQRSEIKEPFTLR